MANFKSDYQSEVFEQPFRVSDAHFQTPPFNLSFSNCVFKNTVNISELEVRGTISFSDCIFENLIAFENLRCKTLMFFNCEVVNVWIKVSKAEILSINRLKGVSLTINGEYTHILVQESNLTDLTVKGVNSNFSSLDSKLELDRCLIDNFNLRTPSIYSDIVFNSGSYKSFSLIGTFHNSVSFSNEIKVQDLFIESSILNSRLDFIEGNFERIAFYRNVFNGLVVINSYSKFNDDAKELIVKDITIHSNTFEQNIDLSSLKIENLNLSNNNFKQIFSFYSPIQVENDSVSISIDGTNSGSLVFEEFKGFIDIKCINFGFIYLKNIESNIVIIKEFQNNGLLSISKLKGNFLMIEDSNIGKTEFIDTDLRDFREIVIANSLLNNAIFAIYPFSIRSYSRDARLGFGINKKDSNKNLGNVYKQLKQVALSNKDIDVASRYQSLEYKHLMKNKRFYQQDKFLLWLNNISNSNGYSWLRGIIFTLLISIVCFSIYGNIIGLCYEDEDIIFNYVSFFTSFPRLELKGYDNESIQAKIIIWISRLSISYGIYQTIAAFRKYGKANL